MPGWHCITSRAEWEIGTGSSPSSWQRDWVGAAANELRGSVCRLGRGRSQTCAPTGNGRIGDGWWVRSGIGWEPLRMNFAAPCVSAGRGRSQTCPYRKRAYCDGWQRRGGIGWGLPRINFVALCVSAGGGQVSDLPLQETGVLRWLAEARRDWVRAAANKLRGSLCIGWVGAGAIAMVGRGRSQTCPYRRRAYCDGWQGRSGIGWEPPLQHAPGKGWVSPPPESKRALGGTGEDQAPLRHPGGTSYGCFLSDLTRFAGARRAGPSPLHYHRAARRQRPLDVGEFSEQARGCQPAGRTGAAF